MGSVQECEKCKQKLTHCSEENMAWGKDGTAWQMYMGIRWYMLTTSQQRKAISGREGWGKREWNDHAEAEGLGLEMSWFSLVLGLALSLALGLGLSLGLALWLALGLALWLGLSTGNFSMPKGVCQLRPTLCNAIHR